MQGIFEREIETVWAEVQQKLGALNKRCRETRLCIRQDSTQQRLAGQIESRLVRLKVLDPKNVATYDKNLFIVAADPVYEKPHLELVA